MPLLEPRHPLLESQQLPPPVVRTCRTRPCGIIVALDLRRYDTMPEMAQSVAPGSRSRRQTWLRALAIVGLLLAAAAVVIYMYAERMVEARLRPATIALLEERFDSAVELKSLRVRFSPKLSVRGEGLVLRHQGRTDIPPLIVVRAFTISAGPSESVDWSDRSRASRRPRNHHSAAAPGRHAEPVIGVAAGGFRSRNRSAERSHRRAPDRGEPSDDYVETRRQAPANVPATPHPLRELPVRRQGAVRGGA